MRIALLSTSDTDLLSARGIGRRLRRGQSGATRPPVDGRGDRGLRPRRRPPARLAPGPVLRASPGSRATGKPVVVLGGEQQPSAELMELSTVPIGVAAEAHRYLAEGGPENLAQLHAFLSDTVLLTGEGFEPPAVLPQWGYAARPEPVERASGLPRIGVLYYRAHEASGNTAFAHALADAVDATGQAVGVPIFAGSLRAAPDDLYAALGTLDALVVTVLAAGGSVPVDRERRRRRRGVGRRADGRARHPGPPGPVPHQQPRRVGGLRRRRHARSTPRPRSRSRSSTAASSPRRSPSRRSTRTASPTTSPTPSAAPASPASRCSHARLRTLPNAEKQARAGAVGLPDQARPHRQRRRPRHPGLDDPAAAPSCATRATTSAADDPVADILGRDDDTEAGDALIHALIAAGGQDEEWLTSAQLTDAHVRISAAAYDAWTAAPARRPARRDGRGVGPGAGHAVRQRRRRARARDPHAPATSCC